MLYEYKSLLACQETEEADNITGVSFSICPIGEDDVTPFHSCKVKKCGIHLLYLEEVQEFGLLPDDDWKSKVEEEDDDSTDLSEIIDSTAEEVCVDEDLVNEFLGNFSSDDREKYFGDSCEPSENTKENNRSDLGVSASEKEDIVYVEDEEEEGEGPHSLNRSEQSRCLATLNNVSAHAKEHEQEPNGSEIEPNSAATDHEEDVKPSQSGIMDSNAADKADNEDLNSVSNGCSLFLSHIKAICEGIFGKKYGNELNQESSSTSKAASSPSGSIQERLEGLEETIQNLQSENTKLRDQNHQLSQYLQMPATMPKSPLLETSSPIPMHLPGQNIQILQYYSQMVPADQQVYPNQQILQYPQMVMSILPPGFPAHPYDQTQQTSQHSQMIMSRPLVGFSSGFPANQADHQHPSSSQQ